MLGTELFTLEILILTSYCIPRNVTLFGDRVSTEVIKLKRGHNGEPVLQYDWSL